MSNNLYLDAMEELRRMYPEEFKEYFSKQKTNSDLVLSTTRSRALANLRDAHREEYVSILRQWSPTAARQSRVTHKWEIVMYQIVIKVKLNRKVVLETDDMKQALKYIKDRS